MTALHSTRFLPDSPADAGLPAAALVFLPTDPGQPKRIVGSRDKCGYDCYSCAHRISLAPESAHSACGNVTAKVQLKVRPGKANWFDWPNCFDPIWLGSCDGWAALKEVASV